MEQERIKKLIADNVAYYRKRSGFTQAELAEKINYSDKAVSKWERGDGLPDVLVLMQMAEIFGITINEFTAEPRRRRLNVIMRNKIFISLISVGLVWLVATLAFVLMSIVSPEFPYKHMSFIYALPVSAIVMVVFTSIWAGKWPLFASVSMLIWTVILAVYMSISFLHNTYLLFILGVPLQILAVFWFLIRRRKK